VLHMDDVIDKSTTFLAQNLFCCCRFELVMVYQVF